MQALMALIMVAYFGAIPWHAPIGYGVGLLIGTVLASLVAR